MLSIIIPTLNEAAELPRTLRLTRQAAGDHPIELIVVDCRSVDDTMNLAANTADRVIGGACCRACALNRGASAARGETLLFLHADTLLPHRFAELIERALNHGCVGGAFDFDFVARTPMLDWVVLINRIRFRWTGNFYGDQCIFVRRDVFDRAGGFPHVPLMEDIRFSRRMRRFGRVAILRPPVRTSPRRFLSRGVIRQFATDLTLLGLDNLGFTSQTLWHHYNGWNRIR